MVESINHMIRDFLNSFSDHVKCSFTFDKEVHFPGEIVTGTIELKLTELLDAERNYFINILTVM
jgi:hypothetical protein